MSTRVTYQIGARFASALKGAMEKEAAEEVGISVSVNIGEVSELAFDGVQNPSQYIQEFAALYGINGSLRVKAVKSGVYSVELADRNPENRITPYLEDTNISAVPRRRKRTRSDMKDVQVIHDNLFGSAGKDEVDKDIYSDFV